MEVSYNYPQTNSQNLSEVVSMKVLDLFSGCGGFSLGFHQAGFEIIGFVEWWQPAITTFLLNHPNARHLGGDIRAISDELFLSLKGDVDIIVGGPPCQGFSQCGKRDPKDERNQLYKEYLRCVKIIEPKIIVMENVAGLLSMDNGNGRKVIDRILHDFIKLGYFVSYKILTASDFNVAQNRKRLIIVAKKLDLFPMGNGRERIVLEAISDLPSGVNAHVFFKTKEETLARIKNLKQGEKLSKNFNY